jgi:sterol desaturase/sphingolipid hydroxylase (fatty acid hydroxylase superfamily)
MRLEAELLRPVFAFILAALLFGLVDRLWRWDQRGAPWRRPGFGTDFSFWLLTPLLTRSITRLGIGLSLYVVAWFSVGRLANKAELFAFVGRETWAAGLPLPLEVGLTLLAADFIGYWLHRAFHRGWLWRAHAVHHSSERLDWLAAVRVHPLNDLVGGVVRVVALVLLGFRPTVLAAVVPLLTLYAVTLHANVSWNFGPLRFVFASPAFHRWHHAKEVDGAGHNFAGLFAFWDLLFGTYRLPLNQPLPTTGVKEPLPTGFWALLRYPFGGRRASPAPQRA